MFKWFEAPMAGHYKCCDESNLTDDISDSSSDRSFDCGGQVSPFGGPSADHKEQPKPASLNTFPSPDHVVQHLAPLPSSTDGLMRRPHHTLPYRQRRERTTSKRETGREREREARDKSEELKQERESETVKTVQLPVTDMGDNSEQTKEAKVCHRRRQCTRPLLRVSSSRSCTLAKERHSKADSGPPSPRRRTMSDSRTPNRSSASAA
jgi:hypothetical protein